MRLAGGPGAAAGASPPLRLILLLGAVLLRRPQQVGSARHSVYWNSSNPRFFSEDYLVQVSINDYLDIYCPHHDQPLTSGEPEAFTLFMVDIEGYRGCYETPGAFKRWQCNRPYAPYGPVRFSEKIQRFTPFSLGFEFQPGHDYYYISIPSAESPGHCLKLRLSVCCKATTLEPVTEGPKSQPRGRGGSEDAAVAPGRSSAAWPPSVSYLGLILLPVLWF